MCKNPELPYEKAAVDYAAENDITVGFVLGGDKLVTDEIVRAIFAMDAESEIIVKNESHSLTPSGAVRMDSPAFVFRAIRESPLRGSGMKVFGAS